MKKTLPVPYRFGACAIAPPRAPSNHGTWFLMEFIVHILYPDVILNLACLILVIALGVKVARKQPSGGKNLIEDPECISKQPEDPEVSLSRCIVCLGVLHLLIQVPYLLINCVFLYAHARWDAHDIEGVTWDRILYTGTVTIELKDWAYAGTFFVLIFARPFRSVFCRG